MMLGGTAVRKFGENINTDYIISADLLQESWDADFFAKHAFEKYDQEFVGRCAGRKDNVVVAGSNFGCGSSREQAVHAIRNNGVVFVIAQSYPDIFYRNAINNGLVVAKSDTTGMREGDRIEIDTASGVARNITAGTETPLLNSPSDLRRFETRDTLEYVRGRLRERLSAKSE